MLPLPWRAFSTPENDKEYLALLSFLPLKRYRMIPKFFRLSLETQQQLRQSSGLIGYSLSAKLLRKQFWTLSVWRDQASLMDFVRQAPHGRIMQTLAPHMGRTKFVQWKVKAGDIPLEWKKAKARMK